jgi:hypothetical protein
MVLKAHGVTIPEMDPAAILRSSVLAADRLNVEDCVRIDVVVVDTIELCHCP